MGLDPRVETTNTTGTDITRAIVEQNQTIIRATAHVCVCYKPNIAFYECHGEAGFAALRQIIELVPQDIPIILDAKRGDIGSTAEAYARAAFDYLQVDAVTIAPYMGKDSVAPFLVYKNAFVFVLVRTSNPSAAAVQTTKTQEGLLYYRHIARECHTWADELQLGFVVGATDLAALADVRKHHPERLILAPGIGAQGADIAQCIAHGQNATGGGILPVVARGIANASDPCAASERYARESHSMFAPNNTASAANKTTSTRAQKDTPYEMIIEALFRRDCVKVGEFTLKSGARSPFYIDLRRVMSFPDLFAQVVQAYADIAAPLVFDCVAGIPTAALPLAAALAFDRSLPMIYPRIPKKPHGTGNAVEGHFEKGEMALLLDDLITHGTSKQGAVEILREAGVRVNDLAVLIRRAPSATDEMRELGITLHYALDIHEIMRYGHKAKLVTNNQYESIVQFIQ